MSLSSWRTTGAECSISMMVDNVHGFLTEADSDQQAEWSGAYEVG
jgi:hypothetical protein